MCISFVDDDGRIERLGTISSGSGSSCTEIEEISSDQSGRSFVLKIAGSKDLYFWSSERSKLLGDELLEKLKNLLIKKPSLADLTGISESRLCYFARSFLGGSTDSKTHTGSIVSVTLPLKILDAQTATLPCNPAHSHNSSSQEANPDSFYQSHLSPTACSTKEVLPENIPTFTSVVESLRLIDESHFSSAKNISVALPDYTDKSSLNHLKAELSNCDENLQSPSSFLGLFDQFSNPPFPSPAVSEVSSASSSQFSPYYCWYPPVASAMQHISIPPTESFVLPPLSSLLSTSMPSSLLAPKASLIFSEYSSLDFPPFLPEPLVRLTLSPPSAQQIATYTPLMCDPIVHIPVIGIRSSDSGYLGSAGRAISTTVPPLHPALTNISIPESSLAIENSARETLQLLLSRSGRNSNLMSVLPSLLANSADHTSVLAAVNRGLYNGTSNVGGIASNIAAVKLVSPSEMPLGSSLFNGCFDQGNMVVQREKPSGFCLEDEGNSFSNLDGGRGLIE